MADYEQADGKTTAPWAFISDKITRVVIGEGVTAIGNNAFYGCTAVNDVFAKGTNTPTIGSNAFANCSALTTANILGTATTIADGAFDGNATGRRIIVPVSAIGNYGESLACLSRSVCLYAGV